jgi:hypothetical protein
VYSVVSMVLLWTAASVAFGWILASSHRYRVAPPQVWDEKPCEPPGDRWVARASVPGMTRVSVALVAPYDASWSTTVVRTRVKRHALDTGPSHYASRSRSMLELSRA